MQFANKLRRKSLGSNLRMAWNSGFHSSFKYKCGSAVLVIKTLAGDANLDLHVNFNDLLTIAQNYGQSNQEWTDRDSNLDGVVNFNDLLAVAQNYNEAMSSISALDFSGSFESDWMLARSMVPEPGVIGFVSLIGLTMLRRQRA